MASLVAGNSNDTIQSHLNVSPLSKNKSVASHQKPGPGKEIGSIDNSPSASTLVTLGFAQNESSGLGLYDRHGSVPVAAAPNADGFEDSGLANSTHEGVKDSKNPAQAGLDVQQKIIDLRMTVEKETASIAEEKAARNTAQALYTKQDTDAVKEQSVAIDAKLSKEAREAQETDANRQTQLVDLAADVAHIKVDRSSAVPSTAETKLLSAFLKT